MASSGLTPMALRMPAVFEGPRAFSSDDIKTHLHTPPLEDAFDADGNPIDPANPQHGTNDYFAQFSPGTNETYIAATPGGSTGQTSTWHMNSIPYEMDLDVFPNHRLDARGTAECLEKAQQKFVKQSPQGKFTKEWQSTSFTRVVLSLSPLPTGRNSDLPTLDLSTLVQILGDEGLLGFFSSTRQYQETHFRVRDVSAQGRGRYVLFGKVKRGTFRGSGSSDESRRQSGGLQRGEPGGAGAWDTQTLDGATGTNAQFEEFRRRMEGRFR